MSSVARADEAPQPLDPSDPAVAALVKPMSYAEAGIGIQSSFSAKANEYTGLTNEGPFFVGNFDVYGGGALGSDDATRWRVFGLNLGTEAREVKAEYGKQGTYRFTIDYDELLHNLSDTYRTPLLGAGGNVLTLPGNWLTPVVPILGAGANARGLSPAVTTSSALVKGVLTAPSAAQLVTSQSIQSTDLPAFQDATLSTLRKRYEAGLSYMPDRHWELTANYKHEDMTGMRPLGTVTALTGGDISTIIPNLIDSTTEQVTLGAQYHANKLTLQANYYGSLFSNHVPSMTWSNWALPGSSQGVVAGDAQTISTAPSNQFHQIKVTGAYAFTPSTRLVAFGSYGRATQNDAYLTDYYTPTVPVTSLDGKVVTKAFNATLSSRPIKNWSFNGTYKFDERDNETPVNTYGYYDAGALPGGSPSLFAPYYPGLANNANINDNRSYSKRLNQIDLDADYRFTPGQALKGWYQGLSIDRYCNGSWIDCADAANTKENTLGLEWRATADTINARVGYAYSSRTVDYNEDAWLALVPAAALSPTGAPGGSTAYGTMLANGWTGYGPVSGLNPLPTPGTPEAYFFANNNALANALYGSQNRISELIGMRRYNMADRTRNKLRATMDWQATDKFTLQMGIEGRLDDYSNSVYGLQNARSGAFNLEGDYTLSEASNFTAYYTHEEQKAQSAGNTYTANSAGTSVNGFTAISGGCFATIAERNANNKIDPCLNWSTDMRDTVDTVGASYTRKGLIGGKLDLSVGLSYSYAKTTNELTGGNYVNNPLAVAGAAAGTVAAYYIPATALPDVTTKTFDLRVFARYLINKSSSVRVGYRYQYMNSSDWAYDGLQYGGLTGVLPTNQIAPNYSVNTFTVAYIYSF